eukprot:TRINITY_DN18343_c0_g1_i1.p1 TRINITY_DN18343_c0_g1~~TRINITY_DN18343_c0_g1_i1.p1  ORF type:complete len:188 (+),score=20.90 TRINITY_DN18343_c0_g1_i1:154-717(+)
MLRSLVGSEMCIRDRVSTQSTGVTVPPCHSAGHSDWHGMVTSSFSSGEWAPSMWSSGIFDVLEAPEIAAVGCCCPCALAASIHVNLTFAGGPRPSCTDKLPFYLVAWLPCACARWRTYMREYYRIEGSEGEDCAWILACAPCAICQEARHWENDACDSFLIADRSQVLTPEGQPAEPETETYYRMLV